jgi:hypothetical protein
MRKRKPFIICLSGLTPLASYWVPEGLPHVRPPYPRTRGHLVRHMGEGFRLVLELGMRSPGNELQTSLRHPIYQVKASACLSKRSPTLMPRSQLPGAGYRADAVYRLRVRAQRSIE